MQPVENISVPKCNELIPLELEDKERLLEYIHLREIYSCEYSLTTLFMWKSMYNPHIYYDPHFMIIFEHYEGKCYCLMPLCKEEFILESFERAIELFKTMKEEFHMYCVDDLYGKVIEEKYGTEFEIEASRELADYLYDAQALRVLSGKKLRKKKNHINAFMKENEERFAFRLLNKDDEKEIITFLEAWCLQHGQMSEHLEEERTGIEFVLNHLDLLNASIGGVFIDNKLEGFTIGSTINRGKEVIIHVEKANSDIRGLYPFINQYFLIMVFPEVQIVNREDDLGLEGLRKAKMSYEPMKLENKHTVTYKK